MKKCILVFYLLVLNYQVVKSQIQFSGKVTDEKTEPLSEVQILLSSNDSIVAATLTNNEGDFIIKNIEKRNYFLTISCLGYTTIENKILLNEDLTNVEYSLMKEMKFELSEVEIVADRSNTVKRTATGQIFFLSAQAKNSGNPYRALKEIPKIISNEALQKITMEDGSTPLIMIDGNIVNSGVAPINPKDIESVELIDVISAKYLQKGVSNIINIKLREKTLPYTFIQGMARADVPLRQSMGAGYFEIGNSKHSLYGRLAADYTIDDEVKSDGWQKGDNYYKRFTELLLKNKNYQLGELLFKWKVSKKGYFAAHLYGKNINDKGDARGLGIHKKTIESEFNYNSLNKSKSYILTGSLFYKHLFNLNSMLETTFAYNKNQNKFEGKREDFYESNIYSYQYNYDNQRTSYNLNIDYSYSWNKTNSLNIGSAITYNNDIIDMVSESNPVFYHKKWNEYLYITFSSKINKFRYLTSLGVDGIYLKAGNVSNNYWKPRTSLSGIFEFNKNNSLRISYSLTNTAPNIGTLNPYNTSIDPLIIQKGNPKLEPEQYHKIKVNYTFNTKGLYITPSITYKIYSDIIEPVGYTDNGIFISTHKNIGKFKSLSLGGSVSYRLGKWGRIYANAYHHIDYFSEMGSKQRFSYGGGITANYKKWTFVSDISYQDYSYTAISTTRYKTPEYSQVQLIYNFSKNFYVSAALPYYIGTLSSETRITNKSYQSYLLNSMTGKTAHPWFLIRYTFRKNRKNKINLDNKVRSKEEGISL